jgi:hypothetical protein
MSTSAASPPDPDAEIKAALAAFDRAVMEARLHDDKIGDYLAATAAGIRSQVVIRDDFKRVVDQFAAKINVTQPPISGDDIEALNKVAATHAAGQMSKATVQMVLEKHHWRLIGTALALAAMLFIGLGLGRYEFGIPAPPGQADVMDCTPLSANTTGQAYTCKFWTRLPTPAAR